VPVFPPAGGGKFHPVTTRSNSLYDAATFMRVCAAANGGGGPGGGSGGSGSLTSGLPINRGNLARGGVHNNNPSLGVTDPLTCIFCQLKV
jgi:hypothetical protein